MKFLRSVTNAQLRVALFVLLGILLLWGGLKLGLGIGFGPLADQIIPNGVMFGAVAIFGWNRWLINEERKEREAEEAKTPPADPPTQG